MEHLLYQKEMVATSGGRLAELRGWPPGWISWSCKHVDELMTDDNERLFSQVAAPQEAMMDTMLVFVCNLKVTERNTS